MPRSAVLSALIFNVRIIPARIPLTLRGVRFRVETAAACSPAIGIKMIDPLVVAPV